MITAAWMYGDSGSRLLGQAVAKKNPWRWSRSASLPEIVAELEGLPDRARPIRIVVRNVQEEAGQHKRSRTKVEQRFAGAAGAIAALQQLCEHVPEAVHAGLSPIQSLGGPSCDSLDCESDGAPLPAGADSFHTVEDGGGQQAQDGKSPVGAGSSPLAVLRAHLSTGSPVLAKWMWGDAGLSAVLPHYALVAESNPWRWSKPLGLEAAVEVLDGYLGSKQAERPIRLKIWSSSSGEEEDKCVKFVTTAQSVACAGSIVWEIHFMVRRVEQEPGLDLDDLASEDSFHSFTTEAWVASRPSRSRSLLDSYSSGDLSAAMAGGDSGPLSSGSVPLGQISQPPTVLRPQMKTRPPTNSNRVSQYGWLTELLAMITDSAASGVAKDLDSKQSATPLFVVAGFCPNSFAGMQAVVYNQLSRGIDFWWAKPQEENPQRLERATLDLHNSGRHKNVAGKSRAVYAPLAEKFLGVADQGDFAFGVEGGRAFVEDLKGHAAKSGRRMLLYLVWQENWSSLFARRKFIEGKICYQWSEADGSKPKARFFARQYRIEDGQLDIADEACEEEVVSLLPPDKLQEMYEM